MARLHYIERGAGDHTLVLLHYFGGSGQTWMPVIKELASGVRCLAPDLPGFGASPACKYDNGTATMKEVLDWLNATVPGPFSLAGHSMGGKIALALAAQELPLLKGVFLVAPSPLSPEPSTARAREELRKAYGDREALGRHLASIAGRPLSAMELNALVADNLRADQETWNRWLDTGSRADLSPLWSSIRVRMTVITGASDPVFPPSFLHQAFAPVEARVDWKELAGGHLLPVETPEAIAAALRMSHTTA